MPRRNSSQLNRAYGVPAAKPSSAVAPAATRRGSELRIENAELSSVLRVTCCVLRDLPVVRRSLFSAPACPEPGRRGSGFWVLGSPELSSVVGWPHQYTRCAATTMSAATPALYFVAAARPANAPAAR